MINSMLQQSLAVTSAHNVRRPAVEPDEAADESTNDASYRIGLHRTPESSGAPRN